MSANPTGIAVITGAASGMGQAAAQLMAKAGWPLLLCDLKAEPLQQVAHELPQAKGVETLAGDIADPAYGEKLVAALAGRPVGALVHCAGLSPTLADVARILDVNLAATMRLVDVVRPRMAEGAAAVLFASSAAHMIGSAMDEQISKVTTPDAVKSLIALSPDTGTAYSVSKRGVFLLVRREAKAFGQHGARIVSISPGIIDTPMGRAEMKGHPIMQQLVDASPLKRSARAEEVAAVAVFLCSAAASFVTAIDVLVDGGSIGSMNAGS